MKRKAAAHILADRLGVDIDDWLVDQRRAGLSFTSIAQELMAVTDMRVRVDPSTIKLWVDRLPTDDTEDAA